MDHTNATPITTAYTNDVVGLSQVLVSSNGVTTTHHLFGLDLISKSSGMKLVATQNMPGVTSSGCDGRMNKARVVTAPLT